MAKEKQEDYRKVDQPKADSLFSNVNELSESLDDLDAYETVDQHKFLFLNSDVANDRMQVIPHEELQDADKAKKKANEEASSLKPPMHNKAGEFGKVINFDKKVELNQPKETLASEKTEDNRIIKKDVDNLYNNLDELSEIIKDYDAYCGWIGVNKSTGKDNPVDIREFPQDDKKKIK